jgi:tetratricopeptide (TPR) repeat protein
MGYYGKLLVITGRASAALPVLGEATDIGAQYAGPSSPVAVQNRMFLGQAQLAAGDRVAARKTLTADHEAALAQYGPNNPWTLRTQLALARVAMEEGHSTEVQDQLSAIMPALRAKGLQTLGDLAQALELQGELWFARGQATQAVAPFREAVSLYERSGDAPRELALARQHLAEALAAAASPTTP